MTNKCLARLCIPGLARHFFRQSAVLSLPAVLLREVSISFVFSNARRVLSQCNTRLRLLYLLNKSCLI